MDYTAVYGFPLSPLEERIAELFHLNVKRLSGISLYVHPEIPSKKLANARKTFALELQLREAILCLADATLFGSASKGLLATVRGIYFSWQRGQEYGYGHRSYEQVEEVSVDSFLGAYVLVLGTPDDYIWADCCSNPVLLKQLINFLKAAKEEVLRDNRPPQQG